MEQINVKLVKYLAETAHKKINNMAATQKYPNKIMHVNKNQKNQRT